ncbi:UDP-N-acetyl-D-glucosamine dehydrogenase, partial [Candidatus Poribacteria bacterium]
YTIHNTPKIVGGVTPTCAEMARCFYEQFVSKVVVVSSTGAAEMVKLLENTFRSVNIALVNEMALICDRIGLDIWEIVDAAATKPFGFMPFYPGPGIGGHCIPNDPHYLAWKAKNHRFTARFIELASEINGSMAGYVVGKIIDALNLKGKPLKDSRILILGVAYKRDVGDTRESPALDIIRMLDEREADLHYYDPYAFLSPGKAKRCEELTPELLRRFDCVVIVTDHTCVDYQTVVKHSKLIVDCRNATKRIEGGGKVIKI